MRKLPNWILTIVVAGLIIWLTLGRPPMPPDGMKLWEHTDKLVHALMFGALFFAVSFDWYRVHKALRPTIGRHVNYEIFAWTALAGSVIELIQPSVGRSNDLMDFVADVCGIVIAWLISPTILKTIGLRGN